ncbi:hypothetical protein [Lactobacillus helveticus]|uniref:hypothetical protein n=2 Tax=Lactobacillus helveticus TaxID=1587 RepID=UPI00197BDC29|nr:hypothetical protein [Lactobacillus helveticus]MBN6049185.1 hypothetical protein [Lactobacillus helveticus]
MATLQEIILEAKNNNNFIYRGCAFENYDLVPTLARKLKIDVSFDQYNIYSDVVKKAAERGYSEAGMNGLADGLSQRQLSRLELFGLCSFILCIHQLY